MQHWWASAIESLLAVRTDDPDVRRRGQAMVMVLVVYALMVATLGWPVAWLIPEPIPGAMPVALVATVTLYTLGALVARAGFVDLSAIMTASFITTLIGSLMVVSGDTHPMGWLLGIAIFLTAYGLRPPLLVIVYAVTLITLLAAEWVNTGSWAFLTADADFVLMAFLLTVIWATSTMSAYWSTRVFVRQLEAQATAIEARKQAEHHSKAKSTFLANMSHELRTPLNAVVGYSELLLEESPDTNPLELERIRTAGLHLLDLVNEVLDLSRIEAGRMSVSVSSFDAVELVRNTIEQTKPSANHNENTVELHVGAGVGSVWTDELKLRQIALNLLSNALKFTKAGHVDVRLELDQASIPPRLTLSVTDTGIGIAEEELQHIFEAFEQADNSTTRRFGGTGLGLPVSAGLCKLLEGDLTVRSTLGEGSCFTARIAAVHSEAFRESEAPPHDQRALSTRPPRQAEPTG